ADRVGHPGHEGRLRPDHDQLGAEPPGELRHLPRIRRDHRMDRRRLGDARVSGGAVHLGDLRIERERPAQGVLATTGPNHKNAHLPEPSAYPSPNTLRSRYGGRVRPRSPAEPYGRGGSRRPRSLPPPFARGGRSMAGPGKARNIAAFRAFSTNVAGYPERWSFGAWLDAPFSGWLRG